MSKAKEFVTRLAKDEEGAALIEYTVLLGILVVAVITVIYGVGTWISGQWTALSSGIAAAP